MGGGFLFTLVGLGLERENRFLRFSFIFAFFSVLQSDIIGFLSLNLEAHTIFDLIFKKNQKQDLY